MATELVDSDELLDHQQPGIGQLRIRSENPSVVARMPAAGHGFTAMQRQRPASSSSLANHAAGIGSQAVAETSPKKRYGSTTAGKYYFIVY